MKKTQFFSLRFFMVSISWAVCSFAEGESFDCVKAVSPIEKMICSDEELSALDKALSDIYVAATEPGAYSDLKQSQRSWLRQRNQCDESECLKKIYQYRIAELSKPLVSSASGLREEKGKVGYDPSLSGSWSPGSRTYEGGPGEMQISGDKISYIDCKQATFSIISSRLREDSLWNGIDKDNEIRPYQDVVISLKESPTCKNISNKIMRFLMPSHIAGYASLMLYTSEKDYKGEKFNAWGVYYYSK